MLAFDLDGTILTNKKRFTARTREALLHAASNGVEVIPVTGRPFSGLPAEIRELPGIRYVITSNGAVTTDISNSKTLRASLIDPETAARILRIPMEKGLIYSVFLDGYGYCDEDTFHRLYQMFQDTPLRKYVENSRRSCPDVKGMILNRGTGAENIWIVGNDTAQRDAINAWVLEQWNLHTVLTAKQDLEIGSPMADKGHAVRELAMTLGIQKEEIMAIGDNENDLGMFQEAGVSVAMGNASDYVKQHASRVTGSNEEDGAAVIIETILYSRTK